MWSCPRSTKPLPSPRCSTASRRASGRSSSTTDRPTAPVRSPRARRRRRDREPQRGFGAACFAGLRAATTDVVCFMDCDGSFSTAAISTRRGTGRRRASGSRARRAAPRDRAGRCTRALANRAARVRAAAPRRHPLARSRSDARRSPGRAARARLRDRRFGWPLEMVLRADAAGWRIREVPVGYAPRIGRSKVTGTRARAPRAPSTTWRGCCDEHVRRDVIVHREGRRDPGPGQDPPVPAVHAPPGRPLAEAALARHPRRRRRGAGTRRVVALDGAPGPWLPARLRRACPQRAGGLDERLAQRVRGVTGAPPSSSAWTRPRSRSARRRAPLTSCSARRHGAVLGPALDGGWWAIGLAGPDPTRSSGSR